MAAETMAGAIIPRMVEIAEATISFLINYSLAVNSYIIAPVQSETCADGAGSIITLLFTSSF